MVKQLQFKQDEMNDTTVMHPNQYVECFPCLDQESLP